MRKILAFMALGLLLFVASGAGQSVDRARNLITGLLRFEGTSASHPSIKRNGANLEIRTADDSAQTGLLISSLGVNVTTIPTAGGMRMSAITFAGLGAESDGTVRFCSDCTYANPCAGAGTGAFAKRVNSTWRCD